MKSSSPTEQSRESIKATSMKSAFSSQSLPSHGVVICIRTAYSQTQRFVCFMLASILLEGESVGILYKRIGHGTLRPCQE